MKSYSCSSSQVGVSFIMTLFHTRCVHQGDLPRNQDYRIKLLALELFLYLSPSSLLVKWLNVLIWWEINQLVMTLGRFPASFQHDDCPSTEAGARMTSGDLSRTPNRIPVFGCIYHISKYLSYIRVCYSGQYCCFLPISQMSPRIGHHCLHYTTLHQVITVLAQHHQFQQS